MTIVSLTKFKEFRKTKNLFKAMGITKMLKVPIRKNGMTGSGKLGNCHDNVMDLVRCYGGKQVMGFTVDLYSSEGKDKNDNVLLMHHSIWKTPENNYVDVTYSLMPYNEFLFLPIHEYDSNKFWYFCPPNIIFSNNKIYTTFDSPLTDNNMSVKNPKLFDDSNIITNNYLKKCIAKKIKSNIIYNNKPQLDPRDVRISETYGQFSKPSTATGKFFSLKEAA